MADWQKILILDNQVQAQVLEEALKENEIPHIIRSYHDSAYDGLFQNLKGWGHVEAPLSYREKVMAIFKAINSKGESK